MSNYQNTMRHIIIGTAGHIVHGKSSLVKALTGTDPDRLKEEKEREMNIDRRFAFLGDHITFIDSDQLFQRAWADSPG